MKKSVRISEDQNIIHFLVKWDFAYRHARMSEYLKFYADRVRFERKINECESKLDSILDEEHRKKIYNDRFSF